MVQLFEQDIKTNDRQSSKGNQLKWCRNNVWYKADYMGYEGLVEYVVSRLLEKSSLKQEEYLYGKRLLQKIRPGYTRNCLLLWLNVKNSME